MSKLVGLPLYPNPMLFVLPIIFFQRHKIKAQSQTSNHNRSFELRTVQIEPPNENPFPSAIGTLHQPLTAVRRKLRFALSNNLREGERGHSKIVGLKKKKGRRVGMEFRL